jgi:hypothetical protein
MTTDFTSLPVHLERLAQPADVSMLIVSRNQTIAYAPDQAHVELRRPWLAQAPADTASGPQVTT